MNNSLSIEERLLLQSGRYAQHGAVIAFYPEILQNAAPYLSIVLYSYEKN